MALLTIKDYVCSFDLIILAFASEETLYKLMHDRKSTEGVCFETLLCLDGGI